MKIFFRHCWCFPTNNFPNKWAKGVSVNKKFNVYKLKGVIINTACWCKKHQQGRQGGNIKKIRMLIGKRIPTGVAGWKYQRS
jgi:hypothetical protein